MKYIHFLDSDDMLVLDCIERCVKEIGEAEIIWHDTNYLYEDGINPIQAPTLLEQINIDIYEAQGKIFSPLDLWQQSESFSWVAMGIFSLKFLGNLRFYPQIQSEDALFGMLLFAQAKAIALLPHPLYIYRVRANSTSEHALKRHSTLKPHPHYLKDIFLAFLDNHQIKHYHYAFSCAHICLGLLQRISSLPDSPLRSKLIDFLQVRAIYAFGAVCFCSDPRHIREILKPLEPYMQRVPLNVKIAYRTPRIFKLLRWIKRIFKATQRFLAQMHKN